MQPSNWLILFVGAVGAYLAYDYIRHYLLKCPRCKGAGVLYSSNFTKQYRPCPRCKRKGEIQHGFGPKKK